MEMKTIFEILAGLGIFLIGLKFMSNGLQDFAGKKIKTWIEKATKTNLHAVVLGIIITGLLQSSSGTTALTVALVAGGMMTFKQATGVILGTNIGTTITAFLIGVKISTFAPLIIAVGAFMYMFGKKEKVKHISTALLGFGFIFFGLSQMGGPLKDLSKEIWFSDFVKTMGSNSTLAFFAGSFLTAVVQSSSAFIGITQEMYGQNIIPLTVAIPFVLGANIGTTITAIMASFGSNKQAKKTALFHFIVNFTFGIIILILIIPYSNMIGSITNSLSLNHETELAVTHGIFNVLMVIIVLPFLPYILKLIEKIIPIEESVNADITINEELLGSGNTVIALYSLQNSIADMAKVSIQCVEETSLFIKTNDKLHIDNAKHLETVTDIYLSKLHHYLRKLDTEQISKKNSKLSQWLTMSVKDMENVGDIALDICKMHTEINSNKKIKLSEKAISETTKVTDKLLKLANLSVKYIGNQDETIYEKARKLNKDIEESTTRYKQNHHKRLFDKECSVGDKFDYATMLTHYERIANHFYNIFKYYKPKNKRK